MTEVRHDLPEPQKATFLEKDANSASGEVQKLEIKWEEIPEQDTHEQTGFTGKGRTFRSDPILLKNR